MLTTKLRMMKLIKLNHTNYQFQTYFEKSDLNFVSYKSQYKFPYSISFNLCTPVDVYCIQNASRTVLIVCTWWC